jgi:hypothetical protein
MPMSHEALDLLLEIARCPNARYCLLERDRSHPCADIVLNQGSANPDDFQLPAPWDGDLEGAPMLFIGSNPAISYEEDHPTWSWPDEFIADFFSSRFGGGRKEWVKDGLYRLLKDGSHSKQWPRYWASVGQRAAEIMDQGVAVPGVDYAMTAIVRCKSSAELGVKKAWEECANRYLERTLLLSGARLIVCLGSIAAKSVRSMYDIPEGVNTYGPVQIGYSNRLFAFLPHPNARKRRTFFACFAHAELERLRQFIRRR